MDNRPMDTPSPQVGTGAKLATRKSHRKSRNGCITCKRRKIKCDEQKPSCENCVKHSISCHYLLDRSNTSPITPGSFISSGPSIPNSPRVYPDILNSNGDRSPIPSHALNMVELELLHNFSTSTFSSMANEPVMKTIWRINVPQLGFSYEFVMRGILAMSAMHLAYSNPAKRGEYLYHANHQHDIGLRQATSMMTHVTKENCSALYIFTAITSIMSVATPRKPDDFFLVRESGIPSWLTLFRGCKSVIESSLDALLAGPLGPMFISGGRRVKMLESNPASDQKSAAEDKLEELRSLIFNTIPDRHNMNVYMVAIDDLHKSYRLSYTVGSSEFLNDTADVFLWLFRLEDEYLSLLRERSQAALAILGFFGVLSKKLEKYWWMEGWSNHLMSRVYYSLDEEHRLWIRWPMEEIGWLPDTGLQLPPPLPRP